jgi:hypothetical protein
MLKFISLGWSGAITPSKAGYVFLPPKHAYTNVQRSATGQNYFATAMIYLPVLIK